MHISEGVLSGPVLLAGGALAAGGTAIGLKNMDYDRIAQVGILSSAFFIASLIHVNIGPSSVHLILNGILGLLLGWTAFPAILVALTLQSMFFQFGDQVKHIVKVSFIKLTCIGCPGKKTICGKSIVDVVEAYKVDPHFLQSGGNRRSLVLFWESP